MSTFKFYINFAVFRLTLLLLFVGVNWKTRINTEESDPLQVHMHASNWS